MSRRYKVLLPLEVHTKEGSHKQGDEFEADFTAEEEQTNLESGLLELQPQTYKVVGASTVHDTPPGETFTQALTLGQEQLLVEGGHIELVEQKPKRPTKQKEEA